MGLCLSSYIFNYLGIMLIPLFLQLCKLNLLFQKPQFCLFSTSLFKQLSPLIFNLLSLFFSLNFKFLFNFLAPLLPFSGNCGFLFKFLKGAHQQAKYSSVPLLSLFIHILILDKVSTCTLFGGSYN